MSLCDNGLTLCRNFNSLPRHTDHSQVSSANSNVAFDVTSILSHEKFYTLNDFGNICVIISVVG